MAHFTDEPNPIDVALVAVGRTLDQLFGTNGVAVVYITRTGHDGENDVYNMNAASSLGAWETLTILEQITARARDTWITEQTSNG